MPHFDILQNPFIVLDVKPSASRESIYEAFQRAAVEGKAAEADLRSAREALSKPKSRLQAELSFLLDAPEDIAQDIILHLKSSGIDGQTRNAVVSLPPLSRLNLLVHIATKTGSDTMVLLHSVTTLSEIDDAAILLRLATLRQAAKVSFNEELVKAALHSHLENQARRLIVGYPDPRAAAEDVTSCTDKLLQQPLTSQIEALSTFLSGYRHYVEPELLRLQQEIEQAAIKLSDTPSDMKVLEILLLSLQSWRVLARPLLSLETFRGLDERVARTLYGFLRNKVIEIANEKSRHDIAFTVAQALSETFGELFCAKDQLNGDLKTLNDHVRISPLAAYASSIDDAKLIELSEELKRSGFCRDAEGVAGELFSVFDRAICPSFGPQENDAPWQILRSIALRLNNTLSEPHAAKVLIEYVINLSNVVRPPDVVYKLIEEDYNTLNRTILNEQLANALKTKRLNRATLNEQLANALKNKQLSKALDLISQLMPLIETESERRTLSAIKEQVQRKQNSIKITRAAAAVLAGFVLFSIVSEKLSKKSSSQISYQPSYSQELAEDEPEPSAEPRTFSRANIRYCEFQGERLEEIRGLRFVGLIITEFNSAVDDWNSRCARYRYRSSDRESVVSQLPQERERLQQEAREMAAALGANRASNSQTNAHPSDYDAELAALITPDKEIASTSPPQKDLLKSPRSGQADEDDFAGALRAAREQDLAEGSHPQTFQRVTRSPLFRQLRGIHAVFRQKDIDDVFAHSFEKARATYRARIPRSQLIRQGEMETLAWPAATTLASLSQR